MVQGLPPVDGGQPIAPTQGTQRVGTPSAASTNGTAKDSVIPSSPPPEVLSALDTTAQVLQELARRNVNLHFEVDKSTKQIVVQVMDGNGNIVRQIPPARLLDILAGGNSLAVDTHG